MKEEWGGETEEWVDPAASLAAPAASAPAAVAAAPAAAAPAAAASFQVCMKCKVLFAAYNLEGRLHDILSQINFIYLTPLFIYEIEENKH